MTFLPIVERELRVSARRALTYWSRPIVAALALIVFGALQIVISFSGGMGISAGMIEFSVLKWMAFAFACLTGVFLTADSLSEEKREGTMGLLFLTDLRGHDVVLGKLMSHSLQAFYGVLAVFPALGLTLLVGGVTGLEFARASLVICNTLFFSLALGLLVSSISREAVKAMTVAFLLAFLFLGGLPWIDLALAGWNPMSFKPILSIASPGHLFAVTSANRPVEFWQWLGIQHGMAWFFLALASLRTPRSWQEKSAATDLRNLGLLRRMRFGGRRARLALRRRLLEQWPVFWLAVRDRWLPRLAWACASLVLAIGSWGLLKEYDAYRMTTGSPGMAVYSESFSFLRVLLVFALMLWVASQASGFFVEGVRTGALELMLVTPVTPREIVRSQWRALWRTFALPVAVVIFLESASGILSMLSFQKMMAASNASTNVDQILSGIIRIISGALMVTTNLAALGWFGMWMGLTTRKHSIAVLKTICIVSVLPYIAAVFAEIFFSVFIFRFIIVGQPTTTGRFIQIVASIIPSLVMVSAHVFFILWARYRLLTRFNDTVAHAGQAPVRRLRHAPRVVAEPPVIPMTVSTGIIPPKI